MNNLVTTFAAADRNKQALSIVVGWVEAYRADTHRWGMMGIAAAQPILHSNKKRTFDNHSKPGD